MVENSDTRVGKIFLKSLRIKLALREKNVLALFGSKCEGGLIPVQRTSFTSIVVRAVVELSAHLLELVFINTLLDLVGSVILAVLQL